MQYFCLFFVGMVIDNNGLRIFLRIKFGIVILIQSESIGRLSHIFPIKLIFSYIIGSGLEPILLFSVMSGATSPVKSRSTRRTSGCDD